MTSPDITANVPLAPLTTYYIGGPAQWYTVVRSKDELVSAVNFARNEGLPFFVLGCGANILIRDGGIRGLVIHNQSAHARLAGTRLTAESGAKISDLIAMTAEAELSGLEHFVGIPSTVGGALRQNLHFLSPDRQSTLFIESVVESANVLLEDGSASTVGPDFFEFGYDDSVFHHRPVIALDATFALTPKPKSEIVAQMEANMAWRRAKQPQLDEYPSCGSVFKKINGVGAGRLIDECGLKGYTIGRAQVSPKHANYIVNLGAATAADVEALISHVQTVVKHQTGYWLEPEIAIIGEPLPAQT